MFEAHSTDYQSAAALSALVSDGFAILKVGPALTFAMREAFYGLDHIALETDPSWESSALEPKMERIMLAEPKYWEKYYRSGPRSSVSSGITAIAIVSDTTGLQRTRRRQCLVSWRNSARSQ